MRVSFSTETAARAALNVFESYGYAADQIGNDVVTDCPALLAIPAIERRIGFGQIERLDLSKRGDARRDRSARAEVRADQRLSA